MTNNTYYQKCSGHQKSGGHSLREGVNRTWNEGQAKNIANIEDIYINTNINISIDANTKNDMKKIQISIISIKTWFEEDRNMNLR